jgi:hypothetical protein
MKITAFAKTVKKVLNLYCRHGRKIIDFSKIRKMTFTIDVKASSCQETKNFMQK